MNDTIFALATPPGKSGVAVVRVSGPLAKAALAALGVAEPKPRKAQLQLLQNGVEKLDKALVLWFPGPGSFTGEDVAELHLHGSRAVIKSVLEALGAMPGLRLAQAGEFSRRAFLNGKMDLTEAEGLADLIEAETAAQQKLALRQMEGELHRLYMGWRAELVQLMAMLEAYIDFPDEDLPTELAAQVASDIAGLKNAMALHLADNRRGERLREGAKLAILGAPNAGKSSLLNYLARAEKAIVSPTPGTTRDALEVHLDIGGFPVTLVDTAGIRDTNDPIEQEGVRRALKNAEEAELRLILIDGADYPTLPKALQKLKEGSLIVVTKQDLHPQRKLQQGEYPISTHTRAGLDVLLYGMTEKLSSLMQPPATPVLTRLRHRQAVEKALAALELWQQSRKTAPIELQAEHIRHAAQAIGSLTGKIDLEEVLDALLGSFVLGSEVRLAHQEMIGDQQAEQQE